MLFLVWRNWLLLFIFCHVNSNFNQIHKTSECMDNESVVVELAIFCDSEFSSIFNGDSYQLTKYWHVLMWDVQNKYDAIQGVNISFRVNSIISLKSIEEEQFVAPNNGTVQEEMLISSFQTWLHNKSSADNFTSYDVAVLAVSSGFSRPGTVGIAMLGAACDSVKNTILITSRQPEFGKTLAHELAHMLNASHESEKLYKLNSCKEFKFTDDNFLMGFFYGPNFQSRLFSPCSQTTIKKFIQSDKASCLRNVDPSITPLIDTSKICSRNYSIGEVSVEQQCQVLYRNSTDALIKFDSECHSIYCNKEDVEFENLWRQSVELFDGTKCGVDSQGECFWGSCFYENHQLVNVATGQCLDNGNPFYGTGVTTLTDCLLRKSLTPLNSIMLSTNSVGNEGVDITSPHLNTIDYDFEDMCWIHKKDDVVKFEKCNLDTLESTWTVKLVYRHNASLANMSYDEIVLVNRASKQCLTALDNSKILGTTNKCSLDDPRQRWYYLNNRDLLGFLCCGSRNGLVSLRNDEDSTSSNDHGKTSLAVYTLVVVVTHLVI